MFSAPSLSIWFTTNALTDAIIFRKLIAKSFLMEGYKDSDGIHGYHYSSYSNEHVEEGDVSHQPVKHFHFVNDITDARNNNSLRFLDVGFSFSQVPAVVFQYDLSPISIVETLKFRPFYQFITNFMAIIGGVFAVRDVRVKFLRSVHCKITFCSLFSCVCIVADDRCVRELHPPNFTEFVQKKVVDRSVIIT